MTLQTEIEAAGDVQSVGFYVVFDGIETRLSTHPFTDGATYLATMLGAPQGAGQVLDRQQSVVKPGGFSFSCRETTSVELGAFFARRGGIESPLVAGITASTTTLEVLDAIWADGATVYLGQETITLGTYTASPSPRYTGCARGAHSSEAVEHQKSNEISSRPRNWLGRRGTLYEVNRATGTSAAIRSGLVSSSPIHNRGEYKLDLIDLSTVLARPISTGWEDEAVLGVDFSEWDTLAFQVADVDIFGGDGDTVRVKTADGVIYYEIESVDNGTTPHTLTVWKTGERNGGSLSFLPEGVDVSTISIRQVAVIDDAPALVALQVLMSKLGDGSNDATYDVLAGISTEAGEGTLSRKMLGAGIPAAYIDVASWEAAAQPEAMRFVVDEKMSALDFLWREILWRMGGYVYISGAGKIAFRKYNPGVADSALDAYDDNDLASSDVSTVDDEKEVIAGAEIECNWDPHRRTYTHKTEVVFAETQEIYGTRANWLKLSSRSLRIGNPDPANLAAHPISEAILATLFLRQYARTRLGLRRVRVAFKWRFHLRFYVGYRFKLSLANAPDGEGSIGFTSLICEVVSQAPENQTGRVVVECEVMPAGKIIAPALTVTTNVGTQIIGDASEKIAPDIDNGGIFPVDARVRIFDKSSSPPYSVSEVQTVTACANVATVTVDALPASFTLAAGDVVKLLWDADTGNPTDIGADVNDHTMIASTAEEVDGDRAIATKWG